jgi:Flp pilus assembly protein TadD
MDASRNSGLMQQAETLLELGRPHEALQVASIAATTQPSDATVHCVMATGHLALGAVAEAFAEVKRALVLEPSWEWPHRLRAMALLRQSEDVKGRKVKRLHKRAVAAAREAAKLGPVISEAQCILAFAELTVGHFEEARAAALRAVQLSPGDAAAWVVTALLELSEQRWAAAKHAAEQALVIDPQDEAAMTVLISVYQKTGGAVETGSQGLSRAS